jgi:hypothetical protein
MNAPHYANPVPVMTPTLPALGWWLEDDSRVPSFVVISERQDDEDPLATHAAADVSLELHGMHEPWDVPDGINIAQARREQWLRSLLEQADLPLPPPPHAWQSLDSAPSSPGDKRQHSQITRRIASRIL